MPKYGTWGVFYVWTTVKFTKNESIDLPPNSNKSKILLFVVSREKHNVLSHKPFMYKVTSLFWTRGGEVLRMRNRWQGEEVTSRKRLNK